MSPEKRSRKAIIADRFGITNGLIRGITVLVMSKSNGLMTADKIMND